MARKERKDSNGSGNHANRQSKKGNRNRHPSRGSNQKSRGHKIQQGHGQNHQNADGKQQGKHKGKNGRQNNRNPVILNANERDLDEIMKHLYADGQSVEQITDSLARDWQQLLDDLNPDDLPFPDDRDDVRGYMVRYLQSQMLLDDYLRDAPELEDGIMAEIAKLRHLPARTIAKNLQDHPKLRNVSYSLSSLSEEARVVRIARAIRNCPDHQWSNLLKKSKDKAHLSISSNFHRNNPFSLGDEPRASRSSPRDYYGNPITEGPAKRRVKNDQTFGQWHKTQMRNRLGAAENTRQSPMILDDQTFEYWPEMQVHNQSGAPVESHESRMVVDDQTFDHWQQMQGFGSSNQPFPSHHVATTAPSTAMELDHPPSIREILEKQRKVRFEALPKAAFGAPSRLGSSIVGTALLPQRTGGCASTTKSYVTEPATNKHYEHQGRALCHACRMEAQSHRRTAETRFEAAAALLTPNEMRELHDRLILRVPTPNLAPWQHLTGQQMLARLWYSLDRQDRDWCLHEVEDHVKSRRHLIPRLSKFRDSLRLLTCDELNKVAGFLKGYVFPPLAERKLAETDAVADMWSRIEQIDTDIQLHVERWVRSKPFFRAIHLLESDELDSVWDSIASEAAPMSIDDRRRLQVDNYEVLTDMWSRMGSQRAEACLQLLREHVKDRDTHLANIKRFQDATNLLTWVETLQVYRTIAGAVGEVAISHWLSASTPTIIAQMWQYLTPKQRGELMVHVEAQVYDRLPEGKLIQQVHGWIALLTVDEMREFFSELACDLGTPTPALHCRLSPSLMLMEMWRLLEPRKRGEVAEALECRVRDRMLALPAPAEPVEPSIIDIMDSNPSMNTFRPTRNCRSRSGPIFIKHRTPRHVYGSMRGGSKFSTDAIAALLQLETKGLFDKNQAAGPSGVWPDTSLSSGFEHLDDEMQIDSYDTVTDPIKMHTPPSQQLPGPHRFPGYVSELKANSHQTHFDQVQSPDRMNIDQPYSPQTLHKSPHPFRQPHTQQPQAAGVNFQSPPNNLNRTINPHNTPSSPPFQPSHATTGVQTPHVSGTPPLHDPKLYSAYSKQLHAIGGEPWPLDDRTTMEEVGFTADDELSYPSSSWKSWSTTDTGQHQHQHPHPHSQHYWLPQWEEQLSTEVLAEISTEASMRASASGYRHSTAKDGLSDGASEQRPRRRERGRKQQRVQKGGSSQTQQGQEESSSRLYCASVENVVDESDEEL